MKILFIYYDWPGYCGGPIVNARRLLPELQRRGHEIHCLIFYSKGHSPSAGFLRKKGVQCYLRQYGQYTERQIAWILARISEIQPDVFVPNLSVAGWFASRWVRESGVPTVAVHRSDDAYHWAMVDEFVTGQREWALSGLVCVSEDLHRKVAMREPPRTKLCVIPSGVPVTSQSSSQTGPLKLVYVGRLVQEQKRILDLVDALAMTMRRHIDVTATLIGDGTERKAVLQQIDCYGLRERIEVMGAVPNEKIQAVICQSHVLVLLSDYEGTPGSVMDGMAAGLVPVSLDIEGGVQELIIHEKTGLLVKDRGRDFVDAIARLANDMRLRKRLSASAKAHVAKHFSLNMAADRWEAFCSELAMGDSLRSSVLVPKKFILPPVRPGLDREDCRMGALPIRAIRTLARPVKRKFLKAVAPSK
jgi:glycosyltransferase involved in cell wall biosynthesis